MKLYAFPLITLLLAACGGGSDKTTTPDVVTQPTQPEVKLTVSLNNTSITLDENETKTLSASIDYNGSDSIIFDSVISDSDLSALVSVDYSDGVISISANEVTTDTSVSIKATFSAGALTTEKTFTVGINDVANNYTLKTSDGIEVVRGNPSNLTLVNTNLTEGDILNFPTENGVALYFAEHESPYSIALESLSNITSSDEQVIVVDQSANTLTANSPGTSTISMTFADISKQFQVTVAAGEPVITGKVNYQRIPFVADDSGMPGNIKLDIENPVINPVRKVVINLFDNEDILVVSTVSASDGSYKFELAKENVNKAYKIEVRAQLELDSEINDGFKIVVTDQSTAGALSEQTVYNHVTPVFDLSSGVNQQDITLTVGWNNESKAFDTPIAQPFAILDTIYKTASYLASGGVTYSDSLDDLVINWSQEQGTIERQAAFYSASDNRIFLNGEQLDWASIEEWSEVVISHEFTHFYQKKILGRDDSTGGNHKHWDSTQITVAFSEGLAQSIAYAVHNEWADKRPQPNVLASSSADDYHVIAQDELASNCKTERTLYDGSTARFNCHRFSPWEEVTNSYFILSLISNKTETPRTANLANEIGIAGLHKSLTQAAQSEAYMSVYSLANALKSEFSGQTAGIDNLAQKLGFVIEDQWGTNQTSVDSHKVDETTAMDSAGYLSVYTSIAEGSTEQVCFNGGLPSVSINRAGTSRYVSFKAESDGMVLVRVEDAVDVDGNSHSYEFYSKYKGQTPELAYLFPNGRLDEAEFKAYAGQEYVIDIRGRRYEETAPFTDSNGNTFSVYPFAKNETVCTNVTITKQ